MRAQLEGEWGYDDGQKCGYRVPNVVPIDFTDAEGCKSENETSMSTLRSRAVWKTEMRSRPTF